MFDSKITTINSHSRPNKVIGQKLLMQLMLVFITLLMCFFMAIETDDGNRLILLDLLVMMLAVWWFIWRLMSIENILPLFDIGFILVFTTFIYSAYPLLSFWFSDFQWSALSDNRFRSYNTNASDLGYFALHNIVYLIGTIIGYIFLRKRNRAVNVVGQKYYISKRYIYTLAIIFILLELWFFTINQIGGALPHFVLQLNHNFSAIQFVCTIGLIYVAVQNWDKKISRYGLLIFVIYLIMLLLLKLSGRTYVFTVLIAILMYYHRYIMNFKFSTAIFIFIGSITFFVVWGFYKVNLLGYGDEYSLWSASNEFTSLMGTAFDLYWRKEVLHTLPEVPQQIRYGDITLLVPSQFLPFEKWSTSEWYLDIIGLRNTGVGMMFGVISQGVVGGGMIELFLRGAFIGSAAAIFHNWYIKNYSSFWLNIAYVFISVRIYYTYRGGTGYIFYDILYQLLPAFILLFFIANILWPRKLVRATNVYL